jgi:hypothetical protein
MESRSGMSGFFCGKNLTQTINPPFLFLRKWLGSANKTARFRIFTLPLQMAALGKNCYENFPELQQSR